MNEQEVKQTIDELRKLTQQRDELDEQIEKVKLNLLTDTKHKIEKRKKR